MSAPGRWLDRTEQAAHLHVGEATIAQYVQRYGPNHPNPYPAHITGQHKRFGKSVAVLDTALTTWDQRRTGRRGRPRTTPDDLTPAQHRALALLDAGGTPAPRLTLTLIEAGHVTRSTAGFGFRLTKTGRQILAAYPVHITETASDQEGK